MSDIEDIKSRIDIVDYIGKKVALKKSGHNFKGLCPFHGEKTPSFMVSSERQTFHCFGCGKGGSVLDFVMEYEHIDFREALEELAELTGVTLTKKVGSTPQEKTKDTLFQIHHLASEYYHYLLTSHPIGEKARNYLIERGVSTKVMTTFGLGYSANNWDGVTSFLKKKGFSMEEIIESGLAISSQRGGYDRFRGRLMFPLKDHRGQTIAFSGRLLDPEIKEAKYINSPETPLYIKGNTLFALDITKGAIQKSETAVLMEGEFDVLSSFQEGISNVVAIKGTALTEAQVRLLKRYAKKIIFALDSDVAGDQAARRGIEIAEKAGMEIYVAQMPFGKDPDDVARTQPHLLKKSINDSLSIFDYYLSSAAKRFDTTTAYGKKGFTDELLPILARIENSIVQGHYVKKVAELVSLPEQTIVTAMFKVSRNKNRPVPDSSIDQTSTIISTENKYEFVLLALIVQSDFFKVIKTLAQDVQTIEFKSSPIKQIIAQLVEVYEQQPTLSILDALKHLPQELSAHIDQAMLFDLHGIPETEELIMHTYKQIIRELKKIQLKEQIVSLGQKLTSEDSIEGEAIQHEVAELTQALRLLEKS